MPSIYTYSVYRQVTQFLEVALRIYVNVVCLVCEYRRVLNDNVVAN
jgi:predicted nucleic-acid-binding Zn-ribbon protein